MSDGYCLRKKVLLYTTEYSTFSNYFQMKFNLLIYIYSKSNWFLWVIVDVVVIIIIIIEVLGVEPRASHFHVCMCVCSCVCSFTYMCGCLCRERSEDNLRFCWQELFTLLFERVSFTGSEFHKSVRLRCCLANQPQEFTFHFLPRTWLFLFFFFSFFISFIFLY